MDSVSYLGITFNKNLKLSEDVSNIADKASKVLGVARRNFLDLPTKCERKSVHNDYKAKTGICISSLGSTLEEGYSNS